MAGQHLSTSSYTEAVQRGKGTCPFGLYSREKVCVYLSPGLYSGEKVCVYLSPGLYSGEKVHVCLLPVLQSYVSVSLSSGFQCVGS